MVDKFNKNRWFELCKKTESLMKHFICYTIYKMTLQIFENICRDDDELYCYLPLISKFTLSIIEQSIIIYISDNLYIGLIEDEDEEEKYVVVSGMRFNINKWSPKYKHKIKEIAKFLEVDSKKFNNKVLLPWICCYCNIDIERMHNFLL